MPSPMLLPTLIPGHRPDLRAGLEAMPSSRLLGLVVVGTWSWQNLTTSEKRSAVVAQIQHLRQEYLG